MTLQNVIEKLRDADRNEIYLVCRFIDYLKKRRAKK